MKHYYKVIAALLLFMPLSLSSPVQAQDRVNPRRVENVRPNRSAPLRNMIGTATRTVKAPYAIPNRMYKVNTRLDGPRNMANDYIDPVLQTQSGVLAPSVFQNFEGLTEDDNAAILGFRVVPPDTDGDVGPNHYVQWINSIAEIFDKNGTSLTGPFAGNDFFAGAGGRCEVENDGDPITLYDEAADRWLVSQFVASEPYAMCVAISTTPDPLGSYNQYEFDFGTVFPDYPKLGIWGDSYTMTTRNFSGFSFDMSALAMDRDAMINGNPADIVEFTIPGGSTIDGFLPMDADDTVSGPALFGGHGDDGDTTFELFELDVDWSNPAAATFTSIAGVTVSSFTAAPFSSAINQPNGQLLDALGGFTMHRAQVRDFGTHQSLVANHTVEVSPNVYGIRWYEFRNTGSGWTLHQEGTFSPDSDDRWMGSISMNGNGDIALGYSRSSTSMFPSIYFTGQTADQSGTGIMNVDETLIFAGAGSQEGASRWGDYSKMAVDPSDDNTFWFTTEYYAETASFDFKTRVASFVLNDNPGAPVAAFSSSCSLLSCDFTDASTDSDGSIVSWSWDFGDGNSSTAQNPSHAYAANGTYTVGLTVTDNDGNTGSTSQSVTVNDGTSAGTMHITSITTAIIRGAGSGTVEATVTIVDENGVAVETATVSGQFSGDLSGTDTGVTGANGEAVLISDAFTNRPFDLGICVDNVTHASLTYDPAANDDPTFACETTGNQAPTAAFTASTSLLTATFTDASSDSDGSVVSWAWDFGDGNSSTSQNPSHTYAANGTYTVALTVTDDMGATGSTSQSVTVNDGTGGGTMHIVSLTTAINRGGGSGTVDATFTVVDDSGNAVDGATVAGTFSGDLSGTDSGTTDGNGEAVLTSDSFTSRPFNLGICADDVTHPTLTYDPAANTDPSFDCATAAPAAASPGNDQLSLMSETPTVFELHQNYPNPFNPTTMITYGIPEATRVQIRVYNMLGQVVATVVDEQHAAGRYNVVFNASDLSAGVYLYTIEAGSVKITKRMTLLK